MRDGRQLRVWMIVCLAILAACSSGSTPASRGSATQDPAPATQSRFAGVAAMVAANQAPNTGSVLVMQRGAIVYEQYFDGDGAEALRDTRSVGKSITALAIGIAVERGVLPGLDAKVFDYLDDLAPFRHDAPAKREITIEDFLTMSSALDCYDDEDESVGNERHMYPKPSWARWAVDIPVRSTFRRDASGRGQWHYCTAGTFLLGQVLQRAAKRPVDRFIAEAIFTPLGITRWDFTRSPTGEVMTGGMLRLRTRDLGILGEMVRMRGAYAGKQIVPAAFIDRALTVHRTAFADQQQDYGYLFWKRPYQTPCGERSAWFASGNGGNLIAIFHDLEAVVVVTRTHFNQRRAMHDQTKALVEHHVLPTLCELRH